MASLVNKITSFIRSPRGQKMMEQGKRQLAKPQNRRKLDQLTSRFTRKH